MTCSVRVFLWCMVNGIIGKFSIMSVTPVNYVTNVNVERQRKYLLATPNAKSVTMEHLLNRQEVLISAEIYGLQPQPLGFEIHALEHIFDKNYKHIGTPCRAITPEIIWIKDTSGHCRVDLENGGGGNNMVYCIYPGQTRLLTGDKNIKGYYISFSKEFLHLSGDCRWPLFEPESYVCGRPKNMVQADQELQDLMEWITGRMTVECRRHSFFSQEIIQGLLRLLLLYIKRKIHEEAGQTNTSPGQNGIVRKFLGMLAHGVPGKKRVFEYAKALCISPSYLNEKIRRTTGFSPKYHINQFIVMEAKRQFIKEGSSMKEIAHNLGFENIAHFSRFFKTNTGLSFKDFKNSCQVPYGGNM